MIILGSLVFAYDVFAKLRHREPASEEARLPDHPIANRILKDPDYRFEDDD